MIARIIDWWREISLPMSHHRRIRAARRTLDLLNGWLRQDGDHAAPRVFGYLRKVDPLVFEELVIEAFRRAGVRVQRGHRYSGDGGVDGHVRYAGHWCPVQMKRYQSAINPGHVHDFSRIVERTRAPRGYFVHCGRTGDASWEARGSAVQMISGHRLIALLQGRLQPAWRITSAGSKIP